jgi:hypothetical protein
MPTRCASAGAAPMTSRTTTAQVAQPSRIRNRSLTDRVRTRAIKPGGARAPLSGRFPGPCRLDPAPPIPSRRKHMPLGRTAYRPQLPGAYPCAEQRAASAPDDPHLRPHYETVKPTLRDLPHWGAGGEIDGPAVSIGRQRLFSPSATSLGLATLELEVPRLLVEGQVNVGWPRPPRSRMASPPASTSPTSWSSLGGLPPSGCRRPPSWRGRAGARRPSEPVTAHAS